MRIAMPAARNASRGATSAGIMTFSTRPSPRIASGPAATNAAPATPPISACDELDGRPKYHVIRFQAIAPIRPAKTIVVVMTSASTIPFATVAATSSEMKAPTKFRTAASATAKRGDIARVEIDVATAFAVSWKPLVKSNASAVATTMMRMTSPSTAASGVLDDHAAEDVRDVLGRVDRLLEALEDVLPPDDDHRIDAGVEERRHGLAAQAVAVVLEAVDLHGEVRDVLEGAHARHGRGDLPARVAEDRRQALRLGHRRLDLVEHEQVGDLLGEIGDEIGRAHV